MDHDNSSNGADERWDEAWHYMQQPLRSSSNISKDLKRLMLRYGLHARKGLGQSFLVDPNALAKIVQAADLEPSDTTLEVGPGLGVLTKELAAHAGRVVAVEIDPKLVSALRELVGPLSKVEIVEADILKFDHVSYLGGGPYKVVANLPYYITSPIIRHFLEAAVQPTSLIVLIQKEVAERIAARPGEMSLLAVSVQFYGDPTVVDYVPASSFYPQPKVDSAILRIDVYDRPVAEIDSALFFKVVSAGFSQARKQLHNSLQRGMWLPPEGALTALREAGINEKRRAETLDVGEWAVLCRTMLRLGYLKPSTDS